jgi:hypothetical protein
MHRNFLKRGQSQSGEPWETRDWRRFLVFQKFSVA